ncbi:MAG TPA: hypothetical protein VMU86_05475 [Steroidobacteraceae bacterium]|nr:hypothetical protein [Steroidobacteraceae bacterium]
MTDRQVKVSNADLVDRLARLRAILPLMAGDLAAARRRSNALEVENERLARRVRELETKLEARRPAGPPQRRRPVRAASTW